MSSSPTFMWSSCVIGQHEQRDTICDIRSVIAARPIILIISDALQSVVYTSFISNIEQVLYWVRLRPLPESYTAKLQDLRIVFI